MGRSDSRTAVLPRSPATIMPWGLTFNVTGWQTLGRELGVEHTRIHQRQVCTRLIDTQHRAGFTYFFSAK